MSILCASASLRPCLHFVLLVFFRKDLFLRLGAFTFHLFTFRTACLIQNVEYKLGDFTLRFTDNSGGLSSCEGEPVSSQCLAEFVAVDVLLCRVCVFL